MDEIAPKRPEPEDVLSDRERIALIAYRRTPNQTRLSADSQMRLFALFLQGHSCEEIQSLNKQYSLGQVLISRIEGKWDERRAEHIELLFDGVRTRVAQSTMEAVGFVADQLAAVHKSYGEKAKKYLQTGDAKDFDSFGVDDIKNYKVLVETLQKLTGQEKAATEVNVTQRTERDVTPQRQPVPAVKAADIVRQALANRKK